ncbi:hypothetical protein EJ03DRAFT_356375 [Teratosphaeria nubilosa]|uniref:Uncharacterized protein n=1 Tax=Teratosphaeria nubilosa TaxID=161662 RepID=A0A6G1KU07_9PEZI|nr:hypothetical protein EJ03DRAFT_356375 [Teratosphaeria nubilosa]
MIPVSSSATTTADPLSSAEPTAAGVTYTVITPSPGASPVAVTTISQLVTSYEPQYTLCELPPLALLSVSPSPSATYSTAAYGNYSVSGTTGNGTCTTIYSATETMVCDTTLTDLTTTYPITNCAQEITFSSQYGYTLVTPSPTVTYANVSLPRNTSAPSPIPGASNSTGPGTGTGTGFATGTAFPTAFTSVPSTITPPATIETLTTYYFAPWADLTAGTAPASVRREICSYQSSNSSEECITEFQIWHTTLVTGTATSTRLLNISTTVSGPSQIIVETFVANVTETATTFEMTTYLESSYETHWTSTRMASATLTTGSTVYETMALEFASSTDSAVEGAMPTGSSLSSSADSTSTTHITSTSTIQSTVYVTMEGSAPASALASS